MSAPKLPTILADFVGSVFVNAGPESDPPRTYGDTYDVRRVAYVPASALDAANEALRLERAEVARLRAFIQSRTPDHHVGSTDPRACHPTCKRDEDGECVDHWPTLNDHECDAAPGFAADEECDRCAAFAALSPRPGAKESP